MLIINAGSENKGGTYERAREIAEEWFSNMKKEGIVNVVLLDKFEIEYGNWYFFFKHKITGKEVTLGTHGFTEKERKKFTFSPRQYWNGSSSGNPEIEDWLIDGYEIEHRMVKSKKPQEPLQHVQV